MSARAISTAISTSGLFAVALTMGCGSKPPPPAPPPVATVSPKPKPAPIDLPPPPPPPPPKCEALAEACVADKSTTARIAHGAGLVFTPPSTWHYAQEEAATVAQLTDEGPALAVAFSTAASKDVAKNHAACDAALVTLSGRLALKLPKQKIAWKKADKVIKVGGHEVDLYQVEGAQRGAKKGPLLAFVDHLTDVDMIIGVGFVDDDDKTDADGAILAAIQSIAPAPAEKPAEKKEEKKP